LDGRALQNGDVLGAGFYSRPIEPLVGMRIPPDWIPSYESKAIIRVLLGPQEDYYTSKGVDIFLSSQFSVTDKSDRMGYRLTGPIIENISGTDIISESIPFGSIQVPSDGQPIIMLADRQTTGGYSKIATVAEVDVDVLAQMPLRTNISFQAITLEAAHRLFREREQIIAQLSQMFESERLLRQLTR
jgi:antagonist of KipI